MATLGTLKPELMAALEAIDQQSPVDFLDAETLVDTGLVVFNPGNDYWYELTATGELQLNKYAAWDELRAENARLRAALENLAAEFTPTSPAPQPPTTDEQWNTLGTDARVIAHENFQHGVNVTLWRVSQKAHKALK